MEDRAAKLALARKKLKDHQEKKLHENEARGNIIIENIQPNETTMLLEHVDNTTTQNNVKNVDTPNTVSNLEIRNDKEVNITEILVSQKRNLELQNIDLVKKLDDVEKNLFNVTQHYNSSCQKIELLQNELQNMKFNYEKICAQLMNKDSIIEDLNKANSSLTEENNNIKEQFELTKNILTAKESENDSLNTQLINIQNELDGVKLQLQQLTSGVQQTVSQDNQINNDIKHENEVLQQKVSSLEQQLKNQIRDNQQINVHYENYVHELNKQIKSLTKKNEELCKELNNLSVRESSLIDQISEMEIRLQNYNKMDKSFTVENESKIDLNELQEKLISVQEQLQVMQRRNEELEMLYKESISTIDELKQRKKSECEHDELPNLSKLSAEITSDKIAAQRATEQNRKLKQDFQGLEDAFVKLTKDKLELTEKITAEKFLNRELTIKLADLEESAKDMCIKINAKDAEMIRLQANYRELEKKYAQLENKINSDFVLKDDMKHYSQSEVENNTKTIELCEKDNVPTSECTNRKVNENFICKDDAMQKLQDRFLKIMGEVADLSDEKHRLEHIITQLQNETDTICEYVALYQQQRSLLKKRDEERSAQMKIFQSECTHLQHQLDELTNILKRFADDKELVSYFQNQSKHEDLEKVMKLLYNLKTNSLIDPHKTMDFSNFYPCNCCSGQLIEV